MNMVVEDICLVSSQESRYSSCGVSMSGSVIVSHVLQFMFALSNSHLLASLSSVLCVCVCVCARVYSGFGVWLIIPLKALTTADEKIAGFTPEKDFSSRFDLKFKYRV